MPIFLTGTANLLRALTIQILMLLAFSIELVKIIS